MRDNVKEQKFIITSVAESDRSYFEKVVRIFSSVAIQDKDKHLSGRELEFLYCTYNAIKSGRRDILSLDVIRVHFRSFTDKRTVQIWLPKLIDKLWIVEKGGEYRINGEFENLISRKKTSFNIDIIYNGD